MCVEKIQEPVTRERKTVDAIKRAKNTVPLVCLTAYTAPMAKILDQHCDLLLVGDSLGMAVYGMENTLSVSLDMMIAHGRAVVKHSAKACVIVDMPFGTYENSPETALHNARKIMTETGCNGIKLEGGADFAPTIAHLAQHNIPVMGHIGLLPQSVVKEGGYKIKGKTEEATAELIKDAQAIAAAGAFAIVIEGTIESAAQEITRAIDIPTIGIGASSACDGQILVSDDMLGLLQGHTPKFVKKYENLASIVEKAVDSYACDVRNRKFPTVEFTYGLKK